MLHSSVISYQGSLHGWWWSWSLDNNVHFPTQGRHYRLCSQIIMSISTVATFWPESWLLVFKKWVVSLYTCPMVWCKWFGHSFSGSAVRDCPIFFQALFNYPFPNWQKCEPTLHPGLCSLVQSSPSCKVLLWFTDSSMPAIIWGWVNGSFFSSNEDW